MQLNNLLTTSRTLKQKNNQRENNNKGRAKHFKYLLSIHQIFIKHLNVLFIYTTNNAYIIIITIIIYFNYICNASCYHYNYQLWWCCYY